MAQPNVPDDHHLVRYVPFGRLDKDQDNNVIGYLPQAFEMRPDEDALSVNWAERAGGSLGTRLRRTAEFIRDTQKSKTLGKKGRLAILNVARVKEVCLGHGRRVRIVHDPIPGNDPHSGIRQLPRDELDLLDAIANEVICDVEVGRLLR
jgi:hypothetical protein